MRNFMIELFTVIRRGNRFGSRWFIGPQLGRWQRVTQEQAMRRIDMANEDHCGTCSNSPSSIFKTDIRPDKKN